MLRCWRNLLDTEGLKSNTEGFYILPCYESLGSQWETWNTQVIPYHSEGWRLGVGRGEGQAEVCHLLRLSFLY